MNDETQAGQTLLTTPGERELRVERVFAAPRERVWRALTDPDLIARWWGPRKYTTEVEEIDVRPGGAWRFAHRAEGEEHRFRGYFRELEPPERVVQTFEWDGMPGYVCLETATLEDLGERTRLIGVTTFFLPEERDGMLSSGMEEGMNESYERLDELLAAG